MDQKTLKTLLHYDPLTGVFVRAVSHSNRVKVGDVAGYIDPRGYRKICVHSKQYKAHRLAWLYAYGNWPTGELDHINGDTDDNRLSNLRIVSRAQNLMNTRKRVDNTSGYKGVYWNKRQRRWHVRIKENGRNKHIGYFTTPEAAFAAYRDAAIKYYGEYSYFNSRG